MSSIAVAGNSNLNYNLWSGEKNPTPVLFEREKEKKFLNPCRASSRLYLTKLYFS